MKERRIEVIAGDITVQKFDCIVNSANTSLLAGGGVDGAIHRKAGAELEAECRELNGCPVGKAKITKSYRLQESGIGWVIHAVGPRWFGGLKDEERLLEGAYLESLKVAADYKELYVKQCLQVLDKYTAAMQAEDRSALISEVKEAAEAYAEEHPLRTIAFPSISTGIYGFPIGKAAEIAISTINNFLRENGNLEKVAIVCYDRETYEAYRNL